MTRKRTSLFFGVWTGVLVLFFGYVAAQTTTTTTMTTTILKKISTRRVSQDPRSNRTILRKNGGDVLATESTTFSNREIYRDQVERSSVLESEGSSGKDEPLTWSIWNTSTMAPGNRIVIKSTTAGPQVTFSTDEITVMTRIVFEGTWNDICPLLSSLKESLAALLTSRTEKNVLSEQIILCQTQCEQSASMSTLKSSDVPLTSVLVYVVDENGNLDVATTEILPSLYKVSPINFPLTIHSFLTLQETDSSNAIAVVVVSSVAFICLVLLAGLLFIMRKRQTRFNYVERCRPVSLDAYSLDSVSAFNSVRRKEVARASKRSYGNPAFEDSSVVPSHPLNFAGLSSFCSDSSAIAEEFSGIPQVTAKIDELPPGAEMKNRYANVVPLPETRVPVF